MGRHKVYVGVDRQRRIGELYSDIEQLRKYQSHCSPRVKKAFELLIKLCYKAIDQLIAG